MSIPTEAREIKAMEYEAPATQLVMLDQRPPPTSTLTLLYKQCKLINRASSCIISTVRKQRVRKEVPQQ